MNIPPIKYLTGGNEMYKLCSVFVALAMVVCGAIALYICFAPLFSALLGALPF